ncbi:aminotransferase class IV, partial [Staphylococcus epidermidis]
MTKVLINQKLVDEQEATIPYNDRGFIFGDGIYEYIRVYNNKIFTAKEHFERLLRSANEIGLDIDHTVDSLTELVKELVVANTSVNGGVYLQITRGAAPREHRFPTPPVEPTLMGVSESYGRPVKDMDQGISAVTTELSRWLR